MQNRHPNRKAKQKSREVSMKGANNTKITRVVKADMYAAANRKPIEPLNDLQADYLEALLDWDCVTIIASGVLGSSKTFLPSSVAADMLLDKKIKRVIIARPTEGKGKTIGFDKGTHTEKMMGWCSNIIEVMRDRMGDGNFQAALDSRKIELLNLEQVKGRSWDDTFIIVDEAEDLDAAVAKSLVTRIGINSKLVVTGDFRQQDLKSFSGLDLLLRVAEFNNLPIVHIDFDSWDYCVRSEEAKMWGMAFEAYEQSKK